MVVASTNSPDMVGMGESVTNVEHLKVSQYKPVSAAALFRQAPLMSFRAGLHGVLLCCCCCRRFLVYTDPSVSFLVTQYSTRAHRNTIVVSIFIATAIRKVINGG